MLAHDIYVVSFVDYLTLSSVFFCRLEDLDSFDEIGSYFWHGIARNRNLTQGRSLADNDGDKQYFRLSSMSYRVCTAHNNTRYVWAPVIGPVTSAFSYLVLFWYAIASTWSVRDATKNCPLGEFFSVNVTRTMASFQFRVASSYFFC